MKAILILDIDEKIHNSNVTSISFENKETIFFMKDVKLKPLPQKKEGEHFELFATNYMLGWNNCIDEILGEEE